MTKGSPTMLFKYSGRIAEGDLRHSLLESAPDGALIAPSSEKSSWGTVPKYGATVRTMGTGYDPAGDCGGAFMSSQFQPNNNCYAYGCNMATNSFPQPGRSSGGPDLFTGDNFTAEQVRDNAIKDGLIPVGTTMEELLAHAEANKNTDITGTYPETIGGHYVALMFSPPEKDVGDDKTANWQGDYHWARCDSLEPMSWSQKDGSDAVTNFDFAGHPITDPSSANWRVNQGPIGKVGDCPKTAVDDEHEYRVTYAFFCFMFVPYNSPLNIL